MEEEEETEKSFKYFIIISSFVLEFIKDTYKLNGLKKKLFSYRSIIIILSYPFYVLVFFFY